MYKSNQFSQFISYSGIVKLPMWVWYLFTILCCLALFTPSPILLSVGLLLLILAAKLLWKKNEPPVLLLIFFILWMQTIVKLFNSALQNKPLYEMTLYPLINENSIEFAIWASYAGLISIALGMFIATISLNRSLGKRFYEEVKLISIQKIFYVYLFLLFFITFSNNFLTTTVQFSQILRVLPQIKWAVFLLLLFTVIIRQESRKYIIIPLLLEVVIGFSGFHAGFKKIFYFSILIFLTVQNKLDLKKSVIAIMVFLVVLGLGTVWMGIRGEYRTIQTEHVEMDRFELLLTIPDLLEKAKLTEKSGDVFSFLLSRLEYVDFFAYSIDWVPDRISFADGEQWFGAIKHIVTPRIFFPEKPILEWDTAITEKYTGINLTYNNAATTISLGFFAESYIDFGFIFMHIPLFFIGILVGLIYRFIIFQSKMKVIGCMFGASVVYSPLTTIEISAVKLLGSIVTNWILISFLIFVAEQKFINFIQLDNFRLNKVDHKKGPIK